MKTTKEKIQDASAPFAIYLLFTLFIGIAIHSKSPWYSILFCAIITVVSLYFSVVAWNAPNPETAIESFLKEHDMLDEFIKEMEKQNENFDLNSWLLDFGNDEYALHELIWRKTERGREYWSGLHRDYKKFINLNIYNDDENE